MTDFTRAILTPRIKVGRDVVQKAQTKEQVMKLWLFMLQTFYPLIIQAICLLVHLLSIHLPTCPSIHPRSSLLTIHHPPNHSPSTVHPNRYLTNNHPFIHHPYIYPPINPHIDSTIHPFTYLPTQLSIYPLTTPLPTHLSISYPSTCPSIHPSIHLYILHLSNTKISAVLCQCFRTLLSKKQSPSHITDFRDLTCGNDFQEAGLTASN